LKAGKETGEMEEWFGWRCFVVEIEIEIVVDKVL
jgi:hypothetical protein